jgi:hypothetical protein
MNVTNVILWKGYADALWGQRVFRSPFSLAAGEHMAAACYLRRLALVFCFRLS